MAIKKGLSAPFQHEFAQPSRFVTECYKGMHCIFFESKVQPHTSYLGECADSVKAPFMVPMSPLAAPRASGVLSETSFPAVASSCLVEYSCHCSAVMWVAVAAKHFAVVARTWQAVDIVSMLHHLGA